LIYEHGPMPAHGVTKTMTAGWIYLFPALEGIFYIITMEMEILMKQAKKPG